MPRIVVAGSLGALGRSTVRALTAAGHEVIGVDKDDVDLSDATAVAAWADSVAAAGPVDGLVHLVGGWRGGGGVAGQTDEDWEFLSLLLIDTLRLTSRALFPALAAAGGRLLIVSTVGLDKPTAGNANYLAAKAAAEAWTRALGTELAKTGGVGDVIRIMALFTDADRDKDPDKDWSRHTHVDDLAADITARFGPAPRS
jgi:NAD(P)-dependent dehydrogenase (short-subunit alcohol dehydrogenase family)